jgi:hypothetical protein
MPNYDRRTTTVTRHEYVLDGPTNAIEVFKMLNAATRDVATVMGIAVGDLADDVVKVETEDATIVAYWEEHS